MERETKLYQLTGLRPEEIGEVFDQNPRAYMAVKGAVAEKHLENHLNRCLARGEIREFNKASADSDKDFYVTSNSNTQYVVECKNVRVLSISNKQHKKEYILYCISEGFVSREIVCNKIKHDLLNDDTIELEAGINKLKVAQLDEIEKMLIPKEVRESGLERYKFSADKIHNQYNGNIKDYLNQLNMQLEIDFKRTRNSLDDETGDSKKNRLYRTDEIDIVAACLFSRTLRWEFVFGPKSTFPIHSKYPDRYSDKLIINPDTWVWDLSSLL